MDDVLDTKNDVLYCSRACAIADGAKGQDLESFSKTEYTEAWSEEEGALYGALCPACENPYHGYE